MHVAHRVLRGFGAAYVQGVDFACNSTICYGIGSTRHARLMALQQAVNDKAKAFGYTGTKLTVDGKIGAGTVKLVAWVSDKMAVTGYFGGTSWPKVRSTAKPTKELVTSLADDLVNELTQSGVIVSDLPVPIVPSMPSPNLPPMDWPIPTPSQPTPRLPPTSGGSAPINPYPGVPYQPVTAGWTSSKLAWGIGAAGLAALTIVGVSIARANR